MEDINMSIPDAIRMEVFDESLPPLSLEAIKNSFTSLYCYTKGLEAAMEIIFKDGIKLTPSVEERQQFELGLNNLKLKTP